MRSVAGLTKVLSWASAALMVVFLVLSWAVLALGNERTFALPGGAALVPIRSLRRSFLGES